MKHGSSSIRGMGHLVARTESTTVVSGARMATGVMATSIAVVTITESVGSPPHGQW